MAKESICSHYGHHGKPKKITKGSFVCIGLLAAFCPPADLTASDAHAQVFIVDNGQAQADIVVARKPARGARLAAAELQAYIQKISGAKLPIATEPSKVYPAHIYVGASAHTRRLDVADDELKHDAFRMVSGDDWLVLVGRDVESGEPIAFGRDHPRYRDFSLAADDGRGSLNAVYEFLRGLGCRWYFPGEIGEIVPRTETIALPEIDRTVRPDFALRELYQYYNTFQRTRSDEEILWQLRLGLNSGREVLGSTRGHGINPVHRSAEIKENHPEYFAVWGGRRAIDYRGDGAPCLSAEGLLRANVEYVRSMFDRGEPMVNVSPNDGYGALCQCELCEGKDTPDRGWNGLLSDYVWGYVNRVAKEAYKTHPDGKISCIAYSTYLLPPEKIEELSPNMVVVLCRWRSDFIDRDTRDRFIGLLNSWLDILPSREIYIWDYYLHSRPDMTYEGLPAYFPRIIDEDLKSLKGISGGDFIEVSRNFPDWGKTWHALATNHLNVYVTARLYWDADQDVDAMLEEYYKDFYGPAAGEMRDFVEYCEANWPKALKDATVIDRIVEMLGDARARAGDTVYGKRVGMVVDYIQPLVAKRDEVDKGRKDAPVAVAQLRDRAEVTLDGKLDDMLWEGLEPYLLRELIDGGKPPAETTFRVACTDKFLLFGIQCAEADMENLSIGTKRNEDSNIWNGDTIELMLETPTHVHYQIVIGPAATILDVDWRTGFDTTWSSGTEAAAYHGRDFWSLEVRIPIAGEEQERVDDKNGVSGNVPSEVAPWFFNVCRQRMRGDTRELSAFSPTGSSFLKTEKFGKLVAR